MAPTSHSAKASARAAANTSSEPVSDWLLSLGEDGLAAFLPWIAVSHPLLTLVIAAILLGQALFLIVTLYRFVRAVFARAAGRRSAVQLPGKQR